MQGVARVSVHLRVSVCVRVVGGGGPGQASVLARDVHGKSFTSEMVRLKALNTAQ